MPDPESSVQNGALAERGRYDMLGNDLSHRQWYAADKRARRSPHLSSSVVKR
jgi:hypothetical protein